jgi:hypothetical protein
MHTKREPQTNNKPQDALPTSPRFRFAVRVLVVACWVWLLFALIYFTDAACPFPICLAMLGSGLLIGFVWIGLSALWPWLFRRPTRMVWLSVPAAGFLGLLCLSDLALALRVKLCEGALSEYVAGVAANGEPPQTEIAVGLFQVRYTQAYDGGVYLFTSQGFLNQHGIAHLSPNSKPPPRISVRHLYGPWYTFMWRF